MKIEEFFKRHYVLFFIIVCVIFVDIIFFLRHDYELIFYVTLWTFVGFSNGYSYNLNITNDFMNGAYKREDHYFDMCLSLIEECYKDRETIKELEEQIKKSQREICTKGKDRLFPCVYLENDNPTNGDIIKAMFPNVPVKVFEDMDTVIFGNAQFDLNWWNAPYKRGDSNGSN